MSAETLLNRLSGVRSTGQGRWVALCPAHDDRSPSLAIKDVDGRVLVHCFGGCEVGDVLDSLGLTFSALFPDGPHSFSPPQHRRFDAFQVLNAVSHEIFVAALLIEDFRVGGTMSENANGRLAIAVQRLHAALEAVGHRPEHRVGHRRVVA